MVALAEGEGAYRAPISSARLIVTLRRSASLLHQLRLLAVRLGDMWDAALAEQVAVCANSTASVAGAM